MTAEELVLSEMCRTKFQAYELPLQMQDALARHCESLVGLVGALQSAGQTPAVIRAMVADLLQSYEADLVRVLEIPN